MKRIIYKMLSSAFALIMIFGMASCKADIVSGEMTLVIAGEETVVYNISLDNLNVDNGLISVLDHLRETEGLEYELSGTYLNKVGEVENNAENAAKGKYLYIYTSVVADMDVSQYAETVSYEGKTLTNSGVGAKEMHIEDGAVIYIGYLIWN